MADYGYEEWQESVNYSRALPPHLRQGAGPANNYEMTTKGNRQSLVLYAADGNMTLPGQRSGSGSTRSNNRKSSFFPQFEVPGSRTDDLPASGSSGFLNSTSINVPPAAKKVPIYKRESALIQLIVTILLFIASIGLLFVGAGCIIATCSQLMDPASCPKVKFFTPVFCGATADSNAGIAMAVVGCLVFPATIWSFCTMNQPRFRLSGFQDMNSSSANLLSR